MPTAPKFPTIPVATTDPESMLEAINTLKRTVEMLTGQDAGDKSASHVFVGITPPTALRTGDFWLSMLDTYVLNIYVNGRWVPVVKLPPMEEAQDDSLNMRQFGAKPP